MNQRMVMVTGVGGRSVGSGILKALKSPALENRDRWRLLGTDCDPFSWGLYGADENALVPLAGDENYLSTLRRLIGDREISAILPGTEPEADILLAGDQEMGVPVIGNRHALMPLMMDKFKGMEKLAELGLHTIPTLPLERYAELVRQFGFPLIIKPTVGTGGSRGLHLVTDEEEFERLLPLIPEQSKPCVQPYIGSPEAEYTVGVLSDKDGGLIDSIVIRRKLIGLSLLEERMSSAGRIAISTGYSQGYIVEDRRIQNYCEELAEALGSAGPLNLQLRVHQDEIYVFEIHPRFSGTTSIRAAAGFNEPDILLRNHLDGERFGRLNFRTNLAAIRCFEQVLVPIDEMPSPL